MHTYIFNHEIKAIVGTKVEKDPQIRLVMSYGTVLIWLSLEQAALLVAELEKLYPELSGEGQFDRAVDRYAEEHEGELDQEHPDMPSMANAGLPVTINR